METQLLRLDFAAFKWDVRFVAMLGMLIWTTTTAAATSVPAATDRPTASTYNNNNHHDDIESHYPISGFGGFGGGESYYASVDRILRNGEASFRSQDVRWRQVVSRDAMERRRLFKRATAERRGTTRKYLATTTTMHPVTVVDWTTPSESGKIQKRQAIDISDIKPTSTEAAGTASSTAWPDPSTVRIEQSPSDKLNLSCHSFERFYSSISNIKHLDLSCNRISHSDNLQFNHLADLETLNLAHNNLPSIGPQLFQNTSKLRTINLSGNQIRAIERSDFVQLRNLESLRLTNNQIVHVARDAFSDLANLQLLDLSHNAIDVAAVRALQGIPALVALSVAFNVNLGWALQEFVASWSLKELDASGTGLCAIPAALAQSVHTLNVSYNHFEVIRCGDLDSYPLLQYLDLSHSSIGEIEDDALGRLEILITLQLHDNHIAAVPSSLPSSLVHLYLQNNQINDVQPNVFAQLDNLETLNLAGNQLTYLPGLPLPRLLTLNLRASGLRGLSQSVVKTSPNLKDLLLESNPIKCTDLMGIAEWTTACRSELPTDNAEVQKQRPGVAGSLLAIGMEEPMCCGRTAVQLPAVKSEGVKCKQEPTRKPMDVKPTKRSRKAKMEEIWMEIRNSTRSMPIERTENVATTTVASDQTNDDNRDNLPVKHVLSTTLAPKQKSKIDSSSTHNQQRQPAPIQSHIMFTKKKVLAAATISDAKRTIEKKLQTKLKPKSGKNNADSSNKAKNNKLSHPNLDTTTSAPNTPSTIITTSGASLLGRLRDESHHLAHDDSLSATMMMTTHPPNHPDEYNAVPTTGAPPTTGSPGPVHPAPVPAVRILGVTRRTDNQRSITKRPSSGGNVADWNTNQQAIESTPTQWKHPSTRSNGDSDVSITQAPPVPLPSDGMRKWAERNNNDLTKGLGNEHANDVINALDKHPIDDEGATGQSTTTTTSAPSGGSGSHDYISDAVSADETPHNAPAQNTEVKPKKIEHENDESNIYVAEQSLVAEITMDDATEQAKTNRPAGIGTGIPNSEPIIKSYKRNGHVRAADGMDHEIPSIPHAFTINEERLAGAMSPAAHSQSPAVIVHSNHRPIEHGHPNLDHGDVDARTSTSGLPEQWNAVRTTSSHPGLFIVLGVTIGMCVTLALVQIYRCARPWPRGHHDPGSADDDDPDQYAPTHRDMMPMELLGAQRPTIQYTEAPIEMW